MFAHLYIEIVQSILIEFGHSTNIGLMDLLVAATAAHRLSHSDVVTDIPGVVVIRGELVTTLEGFAVTGLREAEQRLLNENERK